MIRTVAILVSAILLSRPGMPRPEAERYAAVLNEVASRHDFDPLTAVSIIHYETAWRPMLISPDGEDYGLGQVRARYVAACRGDEDPVGNPSAACSAAKMALLNGENNIRRMAGIIAANRDLCRDKTGTALAHQWLAGYQGRNYPDRDRWCQPGSKTWRVLEYRKELIAKLVPRPKPASTPHAKTASTPHAKPTHAKRAKPASRRRAVKRARVD